MDKELRPLLWTIRFASALGLISLSLTGEVSSAYLLICWTAWVASFQTDRYPAWGHLLRKGETVAVGLLIAAFLIDFFYRDYSIFVSVAHFLLLFQLFKISGLKERKDCLQILLFSFFQMLSACTLSVDIWQAVILLLLIPTATAGLFWQQISVEVEESGQPLPAYTQRPYRRWVTGICLAAIPVNLIFAAVVFVLFPRLAFRGAFSNLSGGRSGYNEQVNLSQTGAIEENSGAVLWLQIAPVTDREKWKGYLRGGTLDYFDGQKWSRSSNHVAQTLYADTNGVFTILKGHHGLRQSITLVNISGSTLFGNPLIGQVIAPLATLQVMADGGVRWTSGWRKPLHYDVVSYDSSYALNVHKGPNYLQMAPIELSRTQNLVHQITSQRSPLAQAQAIEAYLRTHYQYSLEQGGQSKNPVENFLFVRRKGPCGHFASSMAVMLRLKGIPSRIVTGYYKGSWNERLQQYLMRERDAHAWVEAYIPQKGWVSFDPTPRVSGVQATRVWLLRLQENWEYLNYQWDRLVIEYDLYAQVKTFEDVQSNTNRMNARISRWMDRHWGFQNASKDVNGPIPSAQKPGWRTLAGALGGVLLFLGIGLRKQKARLDPTIAFYQKFLDAMSRKGFPKNVSETGWEYADRLRQGTDPSKGQVLGITNRYYQTRFSNRKHLLNP